MLNQVRIVFDCEIVNAIPPKNPAERLPDIVYCEGWKSFDTMGLACLCYVDLQSRRYGTICKDNLGEFKELIEQEKSAGRKIGSFNGVNFDNNLLKANGIQIAKEDSYDLLREIWTAAGLDPDKFVPAWHGGYGLDAVALANGLPSKIGNGALAPVEWQRGNIGNVVNYCLHDTWLTEMLIRQVRNNGGLVCPKTGSFLVIERPSFGVEIPQVAQVNIAELSGSGIVERVDM